MKSTSQGRRAKHLVLTEIEKLDARYTGLAFTVKALFDQGKPSVEIPALVEKMFGVPVTEPMVKSFRSRRYVPEKELTALKTVAMKAAIEAFGGDAGLDAAILAKLWQLMDQMTIPQLIQARSLFVRVRAQNLKEHEFLYKTGQLRPSQEVQVDPQEQQRNVLRRIKEIFGLVSDEEEQPAPAGPAPALPAGGSASAA
jgi:hypothetical protein